MIGLDETDKLSLSREISYMVTAGLPELLLSR